MKEEISKGEAKNYEKMYEVILKDGSGGWVINVESIPDDEIDEESKTVPILLEGASKVKWIDKDEIVPKEKEYEWQEMLRASSETEFRQNKL